MFKTSGTGGGFAAPDPITNPMLNQQAPTAEPVKQAGPLVAAPPHPVVAAIQSALTMPKTPGPQVAQGQARPIVQPGQPGQLGQPHLGIPQLIQQLMNRGRTQRF